MSKTKPKTPATKILEVLTDQFEDPLQDNTFTAQEINREIDLDRHQISRIIKCMRQGRWDGIEIEPWSGANRRYWMDELDREQINERVIVNEELCETFRNRIEPGVNIPDLADEFGFAKNTITQHVTGRCECDTDAPTREYEGRGNHGEWVEQ